MSSIQVVSKDVHMHKRWRRSAGYEFARADTLCPLVINELPRALLSLPLAFFAKNNSFLPVAVQGLSANSNLLVTPEGSWQGGYIPAAYRAYPFSLATDDAGRELLCVAESSVATPFEQGAENFFLETGELTPAVQEILGFQGEYSRNRKMTAHLCGLLSKHELIVPWALSVESDSGTLNLEGLFRIEEARIAALSSEALCELRNAGALAIVYCQLLSMQNIGKLRDFLQASLKPAPLSGREFNLGLLQDSGTLSFEGL